MFRISLAYVATCANEILNISNKCPNIQINVGNQHLGKCRIRYFGLAINGHRIGHARVCINALEAFYLLF